MKSNIIVRAALTVSTWLSQRSTISLDSQQISIHHDVKPVLSGQSDDYLTQISLKSSKISSSDGLALREPRQPLGNGTKLVSFNETVIHPSLTPESLSVDWLASNDGHDGQVIYMNDEGDLVFEDIVTSNGKVFVSADKIPTDYHDYWIRHDQKKVLFATNYTKQYRHSYFANYLILDVETGDTSPIVGDQAGDIQYAQFAPQGDNIAYVRDNNLYISKGPLTVQITHDGGPDMFHAVPDWVCEEEVFGDRYALWFSPDGQYIAYLSFNETGVGTFRIPYYMDNQAEPPVYPRELELRYPKAGTTIPTVDFHILDLATMDTTRIDFDAFEKNDTIIGEVAWVTDDHSSVIYRAYNRVQELSKVVHVNVPNLIPSVIHERDGTDGWLENNLAVTYVGSVNGSNTKYYLDMSDESGWNHLYLYPVESNKAPVIQLTNGEWEVISILKVDTTRQIIYFTSTEHHSTEQHLYSISYSTGVKSALVDDTIAAYWSASFSSKATYYILNYLGPDVPYQQLYSITNTTSPIRTITNNTALLTKLQTYNLPNITYLEIPLPPSPSNPNNWTMNVLQRLPPNFNASRRYPILFNPYGGPNSQSVTKRFQPPGFTSYLASDPSLNYITYVVDNRGTGRKGRAFRSTVTSRLGHLEPRDQISAAQYLLDTFPYIDPSHLAIWGWSFGGYLSAKTIELDSSTSPSSLSLSSSSSSSDDKIGGTSLFSLGLITAPVTDWRLYDAIYTERYMKLPLPAPLGNAAGYNATRVHDPSGFSRVRGGVGIMHGTGDDNVHFQNTASLVDLLVNSGVVGPERLSVMPFTDSDHAIRYGGAGVWVYRYLARGLWKEARRVDTTKGEGEGWQWDVNVKREVEGVGSEEDEEEWAERMLKG